MSVKVIVAIIPGDATNSRSESIKKLFSDPCFTVIEVNPKIGNRESNISMNSNEYYELCCVRAALLTADKMDPKAPVIVIKNTSISTSSPEIIANIVKTSLCITGFDLCYLCKWMDMCQLYGDVGHTSTNDQISLVKTKSPNGMQSILFSVSGKEILLGRKPMANKNILTIDSCISDVLNKEIFNGNISAICTVPNIINFDIALNATSNNDFIKLNECLPVMLMHKENSDSSANLVGFIIIIGLILLVAWAALRANSSMR